MSEIQAKANLRRSMRARLHLMSSDTHAEASLQICREAANHRAFRNARCVAVFAPLATEPDIHPLIEEAWAGKKCVVFPFMLENSPKPELAWHAVKDWRELAPRGPMRLYEPDPRRCPLVASTELDCVFVPGVAFDGDGYRLGQGGGYYDALLAHASKELPCIGLMFAAQKVELVPREPHDHPLKTIITEEGILKW